MPQISLSFKKEVSDYFEDVLSELNKGKTEGKYVDIQSFMREVLRNYVSAAWSNYLSWVETKTINNRPIENLNIVEIKDFEVMEEPTVEGETKVVLVIGKTMKTRLLDVFPFESAWQIEAVKGYPITPKKYKNIADLAKFIIMGQIMPTIQKIEIATLLDEEKLILKEEEEAKTPEKKE